MAVTGKVAMVTGAGSGIGRACGMALLNDGYHVVLTGRRCDPLEETVRQAGSAGDRLVAMSKAPITGTPHGR